MINKSKLNIDVLRCEFKIYLENQNLNEATKRTRLSDAFYLARNNAEVDFIELLLSDNFEIRAKSIIRNTLLNKSKSINIERNTMGYYSHLKALREFMILNDVGQYDLLNMKKQTKAVEMSDVTSNRMIPKPCESEVNHYLNEWEKLEKYTAQEKSIDKLFRQLCPENNNIDDVLAKVAILNDFYSTNIFSTYPVAKHIIELNIDERLKNKDLTLVDDIANVTVSDKSKNFYSFATKYCSHHYDGVYPIFDSYVEKMLLYFKKEDKFTVFYKYELKNYLSFYRILNECRSYYSLNKYSLKEIDKYLWLSGKKYFPNNYKK